MLLDFKWNIIKHTIFQGQVKVGVGQVKVESHLSYYTKVYDVPCDIQHIFIVGGKTYNNLESRSLQTTVGGLTGNKFFLGLLPYNFQTHQMVDHN